LFAGLSPPRQKLDRQIFSARLSPKLHERGDAAEKNSPPDHYAVFRLRDFRLYLIGRLFAVIGAQMLTVAVGWELYERTHSPLALGLVGLVEMIAMVCCTLPAGHLADNFNRKRIILAALLVSSSASLGLALISWQHANVNWIYACLFTSAIARTFLWPASSAFLTSLVPRELFPRAVTWNSGAFQLSSVAGPAIGGALISCLKNIPTIRRRSFTSSISARR
jgi:MFS family permease